MHRSEPTLVSPGTPWRGRFLRLVHVRVSDCGVFAAHQPPSNRKQKTDTNMKTKNQDGLTPSPSVSGGQASVSGRRNLVVRTVSPIPNLDCRSNNQLKAK